MSRKPHRSVHPTAIVLAILLVLLLPHPIVLLLAQSTSKSQSPHSRVEGRWAAVRHALHLPPLAAHPEPRPNVPALSLHISSRFDLKRKRALEESATRPFSFADVDAPPQLYFAADALSAEYQPGETTRRSAKGLRSTVPKVKLDGSRLRTADK
ncbi:hypothetical protein B0H12DRAFT_1130950 [Mycena haematopus]|nr:hypothetical protein B0H12DRAFT_1130950 [Mycena haematopus]